MCHVAAATCWADYVVGHDPYQIITPVLEKVQLMFSAVVPLISTYNRKKNHGNHLQQ